MTDVLMVAIIVISILLLAAYVAFCDRIITGDEAAAAGPAPPAGTNR